LTLSKTAQDLARERTEARARALTDAVVFAFTEKLKSEIDKHGGYLGLRHVDAIETELHAKAKQLSAAFALAFNDAAREQEELRWFSIKRPAFDRLIVKRFEHLLMHRDKDGQVHGSVSRRLLPGFFLALSMMLGPEAMAAYQRRADDAVARVMQGQLPVNWDLVDHDAELHDVLIDAQIAVALHFENVQRRFNWFIQVANAHMAPASSDEAFDATWELGHRALHLLVNGLLSDLSAAIEDDEAWDRLAARTPDADRKRLAAILKQLD